MTKPHYLPFFISENLCLFFSAFFSLEVDVWNSLKLWSWFCIGWNISHGFRQIFSPLFLSVSSYMKWWWSFLFFSFILCNKRILLHKDSNQYHYSYSLFIMSYYLKSMDAREIGRWSYLWTSSSTGINLVLWDTVHHPSMSNGFLCATFISSGWKQIQWNGQKHSEQSQILISWVVLNSLHFCCCLVTKSCLILRPHGL